VNRIHGVIAAAIFAAIASPACADPVFAAFTKVCADTRADFSAVTAAANANGWKKSDSAGDTTMEGVDVSDRLTRASKIGDSEVTLFAWRGMTRKGVQVSACTMHVAKSAFAEVQQDAAAWTGFAAQDAGPTNALYRFSDAPEGRHALAKSDYDTAAAGPGMEILTVSTDGHGAILDLLKIKK